MRTNNYRVASGASIKELEEDVRFFLQDGWILQGGISATDGKLFQALTKGGKDDNLGFTQPK